MKRILQSLAFFLLKDMIDERYVSRDVVQQYTSEMEKDWPIFKDTQSYFDQCTTFEQPSIHVHRKEAKRKYRPDKMSVKLIESLVKELDPNFLKTVEETSFNPLVKTMVSKLRKAISDSYQPL